MTDRFAAQVAAQVAARIQHLLDTCPACAERDGQRATASNLSPRRRQILELAADGLTEQQIASRLGISRSTVDATLRQIRQMIGAANTTHAVAIAIRAGVIR